MTQRLKVLQAAYALGEFTIPELSGYAGVPVPTVRSVLGRELAARHRIGPSDDIQLVVRGRPRQIWSVQDPDGIRSELEGRRTELLETARTLDIGPRTGAGVSRPAVNKLTPAISSSGAKRKRTVVVVPASDRVLVDDDVAATVDARRTKTKSGKNVKSANPKYKVRGYTRCRRCGRARSVYRKFGLCRICLREMAHAGELPVVTKAKSRNS